MKFELGVSLIWPLVLFLGFWTTWVIWKRNFKLFLFPAVALIVLPFLGIEASISIASLQAVIAGLWAYRTLSKFLTGIILLLSVIEGGALLHWIVFLPLGLVSPFEGVAWVETGLFYLASYLVPLLVLSLFFMWFLKPLTRLGLGLGKGFEDFQVEYNRTISWKVILMLVITTCLGVFVALYPHGAGVNPEGRNVGVDFRAYVKLAEEIEDDLSVAFYTYGGARPFALLVIYGFQHLFGLSASNAIKYVPVLLIPCLGLSTFFLAFEVFDNAEIGSWAAFFAVCGIQVTVGMYSYFLTNWLGLSLTFLSLGFLFRALKIEHRYSLVGASVLGGLVVFTHPWTFDQYVAAILVLVGILFYNIRKEGGDFRKLRIIIVYLISLGVAEFVQVLFFHGIGGASAFSTVTSKIIDISKFWYSSIFNFRLLFGGTLSVTFLLVLAVIGVFLFNQKDVPKIYFTSFLALTSIVFLFGDEMIKGRLMFNVPISVFAAFGFHWLLHKKLRALGKPLLLFTVLSMVTYTFRALANIF